MNALRTVSDADAEDSDRPAIDPVVLTFAVEQLTGRTLRKAAFPDIAFFDTEWFLLLELFVAAASDHRLSLSDLYYVADVSKSTAIRVIDRLVRTGHLRRGPDPGDARRKLIWLSSGAQARLGALLTQMHRTAHEDPGCELGHRL